MEKSLGIQTWSFNRLTLTNNHKNLIEMIKYLVLWIRVKHLNSISKAETVRRKFILDIRSRDVHSAFITISTLFMNKTIARVTTRGNRDISSVIFGI